MPPRCEPVGEILFVLSPAGFFTSLRPLFNQVTLLNVEDWIGKPFYSFVRGDEHSRVQAIFTQLNTGEGAVLEGIACSSVLGQFKTLDLSFIPRFKSGQLSEILCLGNASTGLESPAQVRLQFTGNLTPEFATLLNLLETLIGNSPMGFAYLDESFRYVCVNHPFAAMSGYAPEQLLGRTVNELRTKISKLMEPTLRHVFQTGKPELNLEIHIPASDTQIEAQSTLANFYPLFGVSGKTIGVGVLILDETERVRLLQLLRENETRLRLSIESASLGTWDWDLPSDRMIWSDRSKFMHGLDADAEVNWAIFITSVHPDDREHVEKAVEVALKQAGPEFRVEYRALGIQDKIERWLAATGQVHFNAELKAVRFTGVLMEITQQKRAEDSRQRLTASLVHSNEELERFASIASHDLLEPLRTISSYVLLLQRTLGEKLDSRSLEFMNFITSGTKRMRELIDHLLLYAEAGTTQKTLEGVDLCIVLTQTLRDLNSLIQESGCAITYDALPKVDGNAAQLRQLFQNLLGNSIKYRSPSRQAQIHLSAQKRIDDWLFCVKDNGIGFEMKEATNIFNSFARLHTRSEYSGSGLGLSTCKRILDQLGGRIWAESTPGIGSAFYFSIPILKPLDLI